MKERMIPVTCPHCGHVFEIKRDTVLIAKMDSVAEKRLEDGSYFLHQCQKCKKMFYLYYPFLYRNPKKKYNLVLTQQKKVYDFEQDEKVILCRSVTQFLLAYKLYAHDLNPMIVLQKKHKLEHKLQKNVRFTGFDFKNECLWFEDIAVVLSKEEMKRIHEI